MLPISKVVLLAEEVILLHPHLIQHYNQHNHKIQHIHHLFKVVEVDMVMVHHILLPQMVPNQVAVVLEEQVLLEQGHSLQEQVEQVELE
jgi:hypothetical protein